MISIGKLTHPGAAVEYLQHAVADNAIDYYAGRGEAPGRWDGAAARALGLSGEVTEDALRAVLEGCNPYTGADLGRRWGSHRIAAFDVTFSAPKSVTLLYALGDDATRHAVLEAHEAAVDAVIAYLQAHAGWARQRNPLTGVVEPVQAELVMPRFRHRTSRPVTDPRTGITTIDPQLHTHIPVASWVRRPDGTWSALLSEPLYRHAAAAGAVGQAAMRKALIDRLGVEVDVRPNGTFEIVGITEAQRREFSRRRQQIEAYEDFDVSTDAARDVATLATRQAKEHGASTELFEEWRERAQSVGLDVETIAGLLHRRGPAATRTFDPTVVRQLLGERGLTAESATFAWRDLVRAIAANSPDGFSFRDIEAICRGILEDPAEIVPFGEQPLLASSMAEDESTRTPLTEARYSTPEMVEIEKRMLESAMARRASGVAVVPADLVEAALAARPTLTAEQRVMVQQVCTSGDGVVIVEGVAGAGKTFALDACREAFEASGHAVIGYALAGRPAQTMEEEASIPSHTIHQALRSLAEERLSPGTVLIVDEAAMIGSRQFAKLVSIAARDGAKLVTCGDRAQLQPMDAGAGFRALGDRLGTVVLSQSTRQRDAWEREALQQIRDGQAAAAMESYIERGRIHVDLTLSARRRSVVSAAHEAAARGYDAIVVTRSRDEAVAINELARDARQRDGSLRGPSVDVSGRSFQAGDAMICLRTGWFDGQRMSNGLRGTVTEVDGHHLTFETPKGRTVNINTQRYGHLDHAYALTAHKAQGVTADMAYVVGSEGATQEWAYTVMSRARLEAHYFTLGSTPSRDRDGVHHGREPGSEPLARMRRAWAMSAAKESTLDYER